MKKLLAILAACLLTSCSINSNCTLQGFNPDNVLVVGNNSFTYQNDDSVIEVSFDTYEDRNYFDKYYYSNDEYDLDLLSEHFLIEKCNNSYSLVK